MSILKGILHHWNKTNSAYDTIHPETEVAQVTDWNQGIVNTLASTALGGLVNTLTSDSLLAKMIQKVLEATGVKYSLGQNGYVCFGSLFGGLIIQWGIMQPSGAAPWTAALPIAYPRKNFSTVLTRASGGYCYSVIIRSVTTNSISWVDYDSNEHSGNGDQQFMISIGY